jgi:DNA-binding beta-propeller fold protein YncE
MFCRRVRQAILGIVLLATCLLTTAAPAQAAASATYVLGQANFTSGSSQPAASGLSWVSGAAVDATDRRMFIADRDHHRVAVYQIGSDGLPLDQTIDNVLGQPNTSTSNQNNTQSGMRYPEAVAYDDTGNRLFVTDTNNNRVLVFDAGTGSISNGMNASYVLGQSNFTGNSPGSGATGLDRPAELAFDSVRNLLFVSDMDNHRVLVYDFSTPSNGMSATYVLGQPNMSTNTPASTSQSSLDTPDGLVFDAPTNRLFVSDALNSRVMVWNVATVSNGMAAANVLGQDNFTTVDADITQDRFYIPAGLGLDSGTGKLYVGDYNLHRVLRFDVGSITNGEDADEVYGQPNFTTDGAATTQDGLDNPRGIAVDPVSHTVSIADQANSRVLFYSSLSEIEPSDVTVSVLPSFSFNVAGYNAGTCNGANITETTSTSTAMNLRPAVGGNATAGQTLTISSNGAEGYTVFTRYSGTLASAGATIPDLASDNATPAAFPTSGTPGFGYTTDHNLNGSATRFQTNKWARFSTTNDPVAYAASGPVANDVTHLCVQVGTSNATAAGSYQTTVIHTAVPSF